MEVISFLNYFVQNTQKSFQLFIRPCERICKFEVGLLLFPLEETFQLFSKGNDIHNVFNSKFRILTNIINIILYKKKLVSIKQRAIVIVFL